MTKVGATELPADSLLSARRCAGDFLDCYVTSADMPPRAAAEIITAFPPWVAPLLLVRRIITAPFGLSNDGPDARDKLGIFPVDRETERELIVGFDDKHLDFRVSVMSDAGSVYLATWVKPHNVGGRIYLRTIIPFHILTARNAQARVAAAA
ncbi:MAG: DUF2867 domain-containing protein [Pseudomonadota bacterium]